MKLLKKVQAAALAVCLMAAVSIPALAETNVIGPVECTWTDLKIHPTGVMSWNMTLPENCRDLVVQKYTVKVDIMANGLWRENYRTLTSTENSREINFTVVGIYRFRVMATFVGGLVSNLSGYSNECSVTSDYINTSSGGDSSSGPGSSGSGISSGPGSSGSGISSGPGSSGPGTITAVSNLIPDWALKTGTWIQTDGNWYYSYNGTILKNKWACIFNPYAKTGLGQRQYDWFSFDENGRMRTGWYVENGVVFYLSPNADGSRGRMLTGWQQIDGYWYYFLEKEGTGAMGAMVTNTTVDGHKIDAQGRKIS